MALPQLTDEQVQTWTRTQKDRWWLENVYRGDLPQLTITKVMTGYADVDNSGSITLGDVLTFGITASNAGSVPLTDVEVSDTMISPDSTTCAVLQPGGTCALTGTYTVAIADLQAGSVVNTATADSTEMAGVITPSP